MLPAMNHTEEILRKAMELPPEARAALAGSLLQSLEEGVDADAEAAWTAEIERRRQQMESGSVHHVSLDEARRRISG